MKALIHKKYDTYYTTILMLLSFYKKFSSGTTCIIVSSFLKNVLTLGNVDRMSIVHLEFYLEQFVWTKVLVHRNAIIYVLYRYDEPVCVT